MPPMTWRPERNSGGNSRVITDNKAWVDHQSEKYGASFASTEPELKQKNKIHLYPFLSNYISSSVRKVTKAEQDKEVGPN